MDMTERDFHDDSSSYDEILDFDSVIFEEENDEEEQEPEEVPYYRSLNEY